MTNKSAHAGYLLIIGWLMIAGGAWLLWSYPAAMIVTGIFIVIIAVGMVRR